MYAGRVACRPLVSHVEYAPHALLRLEKDEKDRRTYGRTPDSYITLTARRGPRNNPHATFMLSWESTTRSTFYTDYRRTRRWKATTGPKALLSTQHFCVGLQEVMRGHTVRYLCNRQRALMSFRTNATMGIPEVRRENGLVAKQITLPNSEMITYGIRSCG